MKGSFNFNGVSSEDLGLFIQVPPSYTFPTRNVSSVTIPGRNGDLYIDNKSYKQSDRTYSVAAKIMPGTNIYSHAGKVVEWLNSTKGQYFRLEDSYDSDVFRMATFVSSGSVANYYDEAFAFNISFKCKPQRFLKSGELVTSFSGNDVFIENPTGYESKPDIKLSIPAEYYDYSKVLMLSIINDEKVVSNVTINIPASEYRDNMIIDIDSENMIVVDENQNDLSYYISMNGGEFPELRSGKTELLLANYDKVRTVYDSYKSIIDKYITENDGYVKSEFKPYDAILKEKSVSTYIRSYEQLLGSKQETYNASSVQAQALTKSNKFTFPSFNTYLNSQAAYITVGVEEVGVNLDDGDDSKTFGFQVTKTGDTLKLIATRNGYFLVKGKDKYIYYVTSGQQISSDFKSSDVATVYSYKMASNGTSLEYQSYKDILPESGWLDFNLILTTVDGKANTPTSIEFIGKTAAKYWWPKSGFFGKDHWESKPANTLLAKMTWNTGKTAFTKQPSITNLNPSTTEELTFYMIEGVPVYDNVEEVKEDEDGNKTTEIVSECHFTVSSWNPSTNSITLIVKNGSEGWFKYYLNDDPSKSVRWMYLRSGETLINGENALDSITINRIGYKESENEYEKISSDHIPTYWFDKVVDDDGNETPGWPDFLDPRLYKSDNTPYTSLAELNFTENQETKIGIHVNSNGYYRYLKEVKDGENLWSEWVYLTAGSLVANVTDFNKKVTNSYYIDKMDEDPDTIKFEHNRCYTDEKEGSIDEQDPPSWLSVEETFAREEDQGDLSKTPKKMIYKANADGLYKWDENTSWMSKKSGDLLLETDGRDTTVFWYMSDKPEYPEEETDNLHVDIITDPITGNPTKMNFIVKVPGYYRVNNESNWKKYEELDPILESDVNIDNTIYYLSPTGDQLDTVTMNIVPRWWML